ncbi:hypothetical protein T440DRAFT_534175 [Plenodomus tracheiphilus IPT5]|uniref:Uncharacterized protein n=1 Tax=Plenodomus tracheiphilus IPT5 TaxID=1408161 RepID=A0A6A7B1G3_9PLEO|nr:hypothetical protein T440DRAFT_534175 [Plenodomus tracheiphilus IPT5]
MQRGHGQTTSLGHGGKQKRNSPSHAGEQSSVNTWSRGGGGVDAGRAGYLSRLRGWVWLNADESAPASQGQALGVDDGDAPSVVSDFRGYRSAMVEGGWWICSAVGGMYLGPTCIPVPYSSGLLSACCSCLCRRLSLSLSLSVHKENDAAARRHSSPPTHAAPSRPGAPFPSLWAHGTTSSMMPRAAPPRPNSQCVGGPLCSHDALTPSLPLALPVSSSSQCATARCPPAILTQPGGHRTQAPSPVQASCSARRGAGAGDQASQQQQGRASSRACFTCERSPCVQRALGCLLPTCQIIRQPSNSARRSQCPPCGPACNTTELRSRRGGTSAPSSHACKIPPWGHGLLRVADRPALHFQPHSQIPPTTPTLSSPAPAGDMAC